MNQNLVTRLIAKLKEHQTEIAVNEMMRPHLSGSEFGVQCGKYQGIQIALDTLENLLRDQLEEEKRS